MHTYTRRGKHTDPQTTFTDTLIHVLKRNITLSCTNIPEIHTQMSPFQIRALTHTNTNIHHASPQKHENPHSYCCLCQQSVPAQPPAGARPAFQVLGTGRRSSRDRNDSSTRRQRVRDHTCGPFSPIRPGGISGVCWELSLASRGRGACPPVLFRKVNSNKARTTCCNFPFAFPLRKLTENVYLNGGTYIEVLKRSSIKKFLRAPHALHKSLQATPPFHTPVDTGKSCGRVQNASTGHNFCTEVAR